MWPLFRAVRRRTFLPLFMSLFLMTDRLQLCFQMFVQNYGKSYSVIESVLTAWGRLDVQNPPASPALSLSYCCSVAQSLPPHGLQHARTPCPPPSPGVCSRSCQWRYLTVSSSVIPFSSCLQSFPASVFSKESALRIRWPKCRSFSFNVSLSTEYSVFIAFRINWFDLVAVQGILKSLLQHRNLKVSN